jgi:hypothetical protein
VLQYSCRYIFDLGTPLSLLNGVGSCGCVHDMKQRGYSIIGNFSQFLIIYDDVYSLASGILSLLYMKNHISFHIGY